MNPGQIGGRQVSSSAPRATFITCMYFVIFFFSFSAVPLHYGLEFDISLPSILQVVFFVLLLIMAGRHSWRGMYKVLIPYLVCLLWWQLFTELFRFTTWSSLLRATLGWVIFVTTLPLLILFTVGLAVTYFVQWFMTLDLAFKLAVTAAVVAFSSAMFYYSKLEIPHGEKLEPKKKLIMILTGSVVVSLLLPVVYINFVPSIYGSSKALSWKEYYNSCVSMTKGVEVNIAAVQIRYNEFQGESVKWTGIVADVKLSSVENRFRPLVTYLPRFLQPSLKCLLGEEENRGGDRYEGKFKTYMYTDLVPGIFQRNFALSFPFKSCSRVNSELVLCLRYCELHMVSNSCFLILRIKLIEKIVTFLVVTITPFARPA